MKKLLVAIAVAIALSAPLTFASKTDTTNASNGVSGVAVQKNDEISKLKTIINQLEQRMNILEKKVSDLEKNNQPRIVPAK